MKKVVQKYKLILSQENFLLAVFLGFLFFFISIFFSHWTNVYANSVAGNHINDIVLDNIPTLDVDGILSYGVILFGLFLTYILISEPKKIPFVLKSLALFIFIRAVFITLTHLGSPAGEISLSSGDIMSKLLLGNDYFFSGHTGLAISHRLDFLE
jgi:hypothetical protein